MIYDDLNIIFPEIFLSVYAMVALLGVVYTSKDELAKRVTWVTAFIFILVAFLIIFSEEKTEIAFGGMFINDAFSRFSKIIILLSAAVVLVMGQEYMSRRGFLRFEYPLIVTLSVVGMMVMVSAGDLMSLYMGLELQSLALYVIAAFKKDSVKSTEAGLKYFVLGALSSGLLLYGSALVYGYSGTTLFSGILSNVSTDVPSLGLLFGLALVIAGLAFKVSAVPFHMWTPDVYEGAPTPVTAFFATVPKMAAICLFIRVMYDAFGNIINDWQQIIALLSILSMFLGAFAAIGQTDLKRLLAYSSIAHMGYALIGLAAGTEFGVQSVLEYMTIYITMNIGVFAIVMSMQQDGQSVTEIASLKMISETDPGKAIALVILLFSLAGIPPMLGFFAKFEVLRAAINAELLYLAVLGVLASVIGAFYYLRIVYFIYFGEMPETPLDHAKSPILRTIWTASAAIMIFGIVSLLGVEQMAKAAAFSLLN
ncbi:MAG: NADH-quinone oxidoreductase subunit NuoN [Rhodobacterales bacterium]|nr:NADH-quinone oxidoreductase subunit NuoN [Rhodobacterales bacterium]